MWCEGLKYKIKCCIDVLVKENKSNNLLRDLKTNITLRPGHFQQNTHLLNIRRQFCYFKKSEYNYSSFACHWVLQPIWDRRP